MDIENNPEDGANQEPPRRSIRLATTVRRTLSPANLPRLLGLSERVVLLEDRDDA